MHYITFLKNLHYITSNINFKDKTNYWSIAVKGTMKEDHELNSYEISKDKNKNQRNSWLRAIDIVND